MNHSRTERLQDLEFYLDAFRAYGNNIVIGITHLDEKDDQVLKIYRDWMLIRDLHFPLYAVDARNRDDVLLMIETLIASVEINTQFGQKSAGV